MLNKVVWTAAAKPFGYLNDHDTPNSEILVLPAFHDVRLIPIDASSAPSGGSFNLAWREHIEGHLANDLINYMANGPQGVQGNGCWYCQQLVTWENQQFRASGLTWLSSNSWECTVSSVAAEVAAAPALDTSGQWSVVSGQWSVVSGQWSVVSGQWSVVSGQWSVVSGQWSVVSGQWSVVSGQSVIDTMKSKIANLKWRICACRSSGCGSSQSGQAMIEVLVGIVALIVLIGGLLQVASLGSGQTDTMVAARKDAGDAAMASGEATAPDYIKDWQTGADKKHYTADDTSTPADPNQFETAIINHAAVDSSGWTLIDSVPQNDNENMISTIHKDGTPQDDLGFVQGTGSTNVDLLPVIQDLVYNAKSITINSKVWMTSTKGFYGQGQ